MLDLGSEQLLLIALIVAVIFGATRLPEVGRLLGRGLSRMDARIGRGRESKRRNRAVV